MAACLHLGLLNGGAAHTGNELLALPGFDRRNARDLGKVYFYGRDEAGKRVFVLGRGGYPDLPAFLYRALTAALRPDTRCLLVNTAACLNFLTRLGGFLSCRLGWKRIGRPILILGARMAIPKLGTLVKSIKESGA